MCHYRMIRMQNIPSFVLTIGIDFIQSSIVHDTTCEHESYDSDINYHTTQGVDSSYHVQTNMSVTRGIS